MLRYVHRRADGAQYTMFYIRPHFYSLSTIVWQRTSEAGMKLLQVMEAEAGGVVWMRAGQ